MRKFLSTMGLVLVTLYSLLGTRAVAADLYDSEGYPIIYVRGDNIGEGWDAVKSHKFKRSGSTYTIFISELNGRFKIADAEWKMIDYGAASSGYTISESETFTATKVGANITANNLTNVTISFEMSLTQIGATTLTMQFDVAGGDPIIIEDDDDDDDDDSGNNKLAPSGTLPVLYINVYTDETHTELNNEILDKDLSHKNYFSYSEYWLDLNGCTWMADEGAASIGSADEPLPLEIKARGNWTRTAFAKKPFKLKLGKKQTMLGMTKSKHFALLAHADDSYGFMRNFTGFNLGRRIGLPWTPQQQPVEVVINGDYRGLYFLTESIRVDQERINITELEDNATDPAFISGGYLVELDNYNEDNQIQLSESVAEDVKVQGPDLLRVTWDSPEEYSDVQKQFVTEQFTLMNRYVGSVDDALWSYMDLDDAVRYYIVKELISDVESYHGSTYLFRDRGEGQKWHFSPLWDCGNAFNGSTSNFFYEYGVSPYGNTWIPSMRVSDTFNEKLQQTWLWFMSNQYDGIVDDIDTYVSHIATAAIFDHLRWHDQDLPDNSAASAVVNNSDMSSRKSAVLWKLKSKIEWLKEQWGDYTSDTYAEPERDSTPAAELPDYASSVQDLIRIDTGEDAPVRYYDLQGMPVNNVSPGRVYIRLCGSTASKVRISH